jgi:hypothetical protein
MAEILLAFKAGRAFRREGTNVVEPSPTKGAIHLTNGDDGLLHFIWKNRTTNQPEEASFSYMYRLHRVNERNRILFSFPLMQRLPKYHNQRGGCMSSSSLLQIKGILCVDLTFLFKH